MKDLDWAMENINKQRESFEKRQEERYGKSILMSFIANYFDKEKVGP